MTASASTLLFLIRDLEAVMRGELTSSQTEEVKRLVDQVTRIDDTNPKEQA